MPTTLAQLQKLMQNDEKIAAITAYDATFAKVASDAGVDVILVGDSLGMVMQGHETTLPVTVDDMVYHTQMVQRGNEQAWCIADMPFMSDASVEQSLSCAARLMKEGGANMVKLEGGDRVMPAVQAMSEMGIPVCGHLGLLPQSVQKYGYAVQGRDDKVAKKILMDAVGLQHAGCEMLVLECVPEILAAEITAELSIPVIGIGSGAQTSGQVLVMQDMLGITPGSAPKFSKNFMLESDSIQAAFSAYVMAVKSGQFPAKEHIIA